MKALAIAALFVAACGGKSAPATTAPTPDGDDDAVEDVVEDAPSEAVTLVGLDRDDLGYCTVTVVRADDTDGEYEADFDLCPDGSRDASALIGAQVILVRDTVETPPEECGADPECIESVGPTTSEKVVEITPAP